MDVKALRIDMRGLLMDVCGLIICVGMTNEQRNADGWDMGEQNSRCGRWPWYTYEEKKNEVQK